MISQIYDTHTRSHLSFYHQAPSMVEATSCVKSFLNYLTPHMLLRGPPFYTFVLVGSPQATYSVP